MNKKLILKLFLLIFSLSTSIEVICFTITQAPRPSEKYFTLNIATGERDVTEGPNKRNEITYQKFRGPDYALLSNFDTVDKLPLKITIKNDKEHKVLLTEEMFKKILNEAGLNITTKEDIIKIINTDKVNIVFGLFKKSEDIPADMQFKDKSGNIPLFGIKIKVTN